MSDITELFSRDPISLADTDIDAIIEHFRKSNHQYSLGNIKAGSTKPKTSKQKAVEKAAEELSDIIEL